MTDDTPPIRRFAAVPPPPPLSVGAHDRPPYGDGPDGPDDYGVKAKGTDWNEAEILGGDDDDETGAPLSREKSRPEPGVYFGRSRRE